MKRLHLIALCALPAFLIGGYIVWREGHPEPEPRITFVEYAKEDDPHFGKIGIFRVENPGKRDCTFLGFQENSPICNVLQEDESGRWRELWFDGCYMGARPLVLSAGADLLLERPFPDGAEAGRPCRFGFDYYPGPPKMYEYPSSLIVRGSGATQLEEFYRQARILLGGGSLKYREVWSPPFIVETAPPASPEWH